MTDYRCHEAHLGATVCPSRGKGHTAAKYILRVLEAIAMDAEQVMLDLGSINI